MKPMLLQTTTDLPTGDNWRYEVKYDGFRTILFWTKETIRLESRNERLLTDQFPEIHDFCQRISNKVEAWLPITIDGELVHLVSPYRAHFAPIQTRSFMRKHETIAASSIKTPATLLAFDILELKGKTLVDLPYDERKKQLKALLKAIDVPLEPTIQSNACLQMIPAQTDGQALWQAVELHHGEGVVAKDRFSDWTEGKRTNRWLKKKNFRQVTVFLTAYDPVNGYFHFAVYRDGTSVEVGNVTHGFEDHERETLIAFMKQNGMKKGKRYVLEPSVCFDVDCIDFDGKHLREPMFHRFRLDVKPAQCTWKSLQRQLAPLPPQVEITHPDKPLWPRQMIQKIDYLYYLQEVAPAMLPFLIDRPLTVIRYPHGVRSNTEREAFYQKNCPDYAPSFVKTVRLDEIRYIVCNDIQTLVWLGNQLALEFHIPYHPVPYTKPSEIVFDLDPPSISQFSLAVKAAQLMKNMFDALKLQSFVKTSGGKGLQLYLPLPDNTFTYDDTRLFSKTVCELLCSQFPEDFTTERLKKHRGQRLYLDYLQHDEGKTIVAPFSPRGNEGGFIATPLRWEEVTNTLSPDQFPMKAVLERYRNGIQPFATFAEAKKTQPFADVLKKFKR
ncbi:BH2209 [Halalkalibacterium halodurans C-125]|uniref:DNA ligase (ATP) n=2 Tax=Halalkalibacterium halodurans TaxID=86665 RepID=Q9KAS8_HALH5|nr:BH2209 [Halalkalibacterium halodurans C-125]